MIRSPLEGESFFFVISLTLFVMLTLSSSSLNAQNTVGLLSKKAGEFSNGYNLVYPFGQPNVYLLDSCGQIVHRWDDHEDFHPGLMSYLLPNGNLIKTKRDRVYQNDAFGGFSSGATVDVLSWENELLAQFTLNNNTEKLHHDIEPMPNGNVLMISWQRIFPDSLAKLGRDTAIMPGIHLLTDKIIEWNPSLDSIVWEWHVGDHLVQNFDPSLSTFGEVSNPGKVNLNYPNAIVTDWLHMNAIDYNPVLDQIIVSVPTFNEFWIIDHSTTKSEAASSSGGLAGKGGDLLARWGNPMAYNQGSEADQVLFYQHDVQWTNPLAEMSDADFGEIILFNNRHDQGSRVNFLNLEFNPTNWSYEKNQETFLPNNFSKTVTHPSNNIFLNSDIISSAQALPNGNTLIFGGEWGYAVELDANDELVWEYRLPLRNGNRVEQGADVQVRANMSFRFIKYPENFPAFLDKDLSPLEYLELEPNDVFCDPLSSTNDLGFTKVKFFPNPMSNKINIVVEQKTEVLLFDSLGNLLNKLKCSEGVNSFDLNDLNYGLYFLKHNSEVYKMIKS